MMMDADDLSKTLERAVKGANDQSAQDSLGPICSVTGLPEGHLKKHLNNIVKTVFKSKPVLGCFDTDNVDALGVPHYH